MQVVPRGSGSEIVFTLLRQPGMSDEKFSEDAEWVGKDLTILKRLSDSNRRDLPMKALNKAALAVLFAASELSGALAAEALIYPARIFSGAQAVAAVTCGDFDPVHPGKEIACLMADGSVLELALEASGWTARTIFVYKGSAPPWAGPTMRVSLNVGDVLVGNPGQEIVMSFFQQVFAVYYSPGKGWTNQIVADFTGLIGTSWGAEVGDCDHSHAGEEVFFIFEGLLDFSSGSVHRERNGIWERNDVYYGEVGMDAAIGDSNPDLPGDEIIVVTEMGPAYEIAPPALGGPGPWPRRTIWDDEPNAGWVVKIGDVDPASPGNEIVYGTRYSDRIMMSWHNGANMHEVDILFTGANTNPLNSMLDVSIGQVFPASPGAEILAVDMSGSVYLVEQVTNRWQGSVLWRDTDALYAVAGADLAPTPGDEVIVAGASGVVTLLCNAAPVVNIALPVRQQAVLSWNGIAGVTYAVETTTNLASRPAWKHLTNLVYQGGFQGGISYTNTVGGAAPERFFRIGASW